MSAVEKATRDALSPEFPLTLNAFLSALDANAFPDACGWQPLFVRLGVDERAALDEAIVRHGARCVDAIDRQLDDLAAIRFPSPLQASQRTQLRAEIDAAPGGADVFGLWAWFGWLRCIVHLLPPDDYYAVITNRNHDKITLEEQSVLRTKRIGVIGLSVGGEAAVTVAQEHLCGEIVIADFDKLDLSNLNRLHAGVDELGENKSHIVARRIARIDPYLRVTVFPDGVHPSNLSEFMRGLDLLLEECDGLQMKYVVREWAMRERVNIVYAADERGFLSVEPYAQHESLPLFHGRMPTAPRARVEYASTAEFYRALTEWIGGWDAISERSRQSLMSLETRLCGYPQLASEARFAAGMVGHVARRLLLGERVAPGVQFVDLDSLCLNEGGQH